MIKQIKYFLLIIIIPLLTQAQSALDVTGRVSFRMLNVDYDEHSKINPDSANYGKTTLIPGLRQSLNMALFARTASMDITLLGELNNNDWNKLNSYKNVDRLSISARFAENEIVLGDYFTSGSELFIQSREVRGAKAELWLNDLWNDQSYIKTLVNAGIVQRAYDEGEQMRGLYQQFESTGLYRRLFGSAVMEMGERQRYNLAAKYVYGKDDEKSISESINDPLSNQNIGFEGSVYFWDQNIKIFSEAYFSKKDTLNAGTADDHAWKAGVDFRYNTFKLQAFYQRLGFDYYTAGNPFLLTDWQGFRMIGAFEVLSGLIINWEGQHYKNNLKNFEYLPVTTTRIGDLGFLTQFEGWPDLGLRFRFQDDLSATKYDDNNQAIKTDKTSRTYDATIGKSFGNHRLSLTAMYIKLDDQSVIIGAQPLGTNQFVSSLNFYTRPSQYLFLSGGVVYSDLSLTDGQKNRNMVFYESSRWDLIPGKFTFETNLSYVYNKADGGSGYQDLLSNYDQLDLSASLEYFFNPEISLKLIGGTDRRNMRYSHRDALEVITDPDYGPMYFNGYESYDGLKYGAEINWIF